MELKLSAGETGVRARGDVTKVLEYLRPEGPQLNSCALECTDGLCAIPQDMHPPESHCVSAPWSDRALVKEDVMHKAGIIAVALAVSALLGGCGGLGPEVCTDELGWRVHPAEANLMIGESITAEAEAFTCGGKESLEVDVRWSSENPAVASVNEKTGRITAKGAGTTKISDEDLGPYGIGPVEIPVEVED